MVKTNEHWTSRRSVRSLGNKRKKVSLLQAWRRAHRRKSAVTQQRKQIEQEVEGIPSWMLPQRSYTSGNRKTRVYSWCKRKPRSPMEQKLGPNSSSRRGYCTVGGFHEEHLKEMSGAVLPRKCCDAVLRLAHDVPIAGHLGGD